MNKVPFACVAALCAAVCAGTVRAQESRSLCDQLNGAASAADARVALNKSQETFAAAGRYSDFVEQLLGCSLKNKKVPLALVQFAIASCRFDQLNYLEQQQLWDEYFNRGDEYRRQINDALVKVIADTPVKDSLHLSARLLFWQFHRKLEDAVQEQALGDLLTAGREYAKLTASEPRPLKDTADALMAAGERSKARELYKLYAEKVFSAVSSNEELQNEASSAYKQGNLELAESLYSVFIERIMNAYSKDRLKLELAEIARKFAYKDGALHDSEFAEKIFVKMSVITGQVFDEELLYLRAYNLEKAKLFADAAVQYSAFLQQYPQSPLADKVICKLGLIQAYALRDAAAAQASLARLKDRENGGTYAVTSLYQLGLLAQWQGRLQEAREFYNLAVERAGADFPHTRRLIDARIEEIRKGGALENNLQLFLDLSLKEENSTFAMTKVSLNASRYTVKKGETVTVDVATQVPASGCMQVQVENLWSGDASSAVQTENGMSISFDEPGIKVITMVAGSPSATIDRAVDFIDVE